MALEQKYSLNELKKHIDIKIHLVRDKLLDGTIVLS